MSASTSEDLEKLRLVVRDIQARIGAFPAQCGTLAYGTATTTSGWSVFCDGKNGGRKFRSHLLTVRKDGCQSREIVSGDLAEAVALFLAHGYDLMGFAARQLEADALASTKAVSAPLPATSSDLIPFVRMDVNVVGWVSPETPLRMDGRYSIVRDRYDGHPVPDPEVWIDGKWVTGWFPKPENIAEHEISIRFRGLAWTKMDLDKLRVRLEAALPKDRAERDYWPAFFGEKVVVAEGGTK